MPVWIVSTAKTGHLNQCRALAAELGKDPARIIAIPGPSGADGFARRLIGRLLDPVRTGLALLSHPLPKDTLVIASGRASEGVCVVWRMLLGRRFFVVYVGVPKTDSALADVLVHGDHRISGLDKPGIHVPTRGAMVTEPARSHTASEPGKVRNILVLIGGKNLTYDYDGPKFRGFINQLAKLAEDKTLALRLAVSRRTQPATYDLISSVLKGSGIAIIELADREGFAAARRTADTFIVCPDSITMISECCAEAVPTFIPDIDVKRPSTENLRFVAKVLAERHALSFTAPLPLAQTVRIENQARRAAAAVRDHIKAWRSTPVGSERVT
ncbi:ELM1/GtrOC1 family putative glycosyltransferase [Taklimakanibacter lacteus]|uniref:ELM1/GtrOC1 family putative glycosyltransferase n=1 Tax=Taklimakanibacter lacteus TaxID=2268456 RepID=UPI000E660D5A